MDNQFKIKGMSCSACSLAIEKTAIKIPGIKEAKVSFATETGMFEFEPNFNSAEVARQLKENVSKIGYDLVPIIPGQTLLDSNQDGHANLKLIITGILSVAVFLFEMGPLMHWPSHLINQIIQALLCIPIVFLSGWRFARGLQSLLQGHPNMDSLVGLGILVSLGASFVTLIAGLLNYNLKSIGFEENVYFEGVAFIIFFINLGHFIESRVKKSAMGTLEILARLGAKEARLIEEGVEKKVPVSILKFSDLVRVLPGEKIPADGTVVKGQSSIDESLMTGESQLVLKEVGGKVKAGTINGEGVLEIEVNALGEETFLAQIVKSVILAQQERPKIQRMADKIGEVFVPAIILLAVITFAVWMFFGPVPKLGHSLQMLVSVLVIACPCALGLAIPMVVSVASGEAAKLGLMVKGGDVFEKAQSITSVVFDKTGTLTNGKPEVIGIFFINKKGDLEKKRALEIFKMLSELNEHPLSKAINAYLNKQNTTSSELDIETFEAVAGKGVMAKVSGQKYFMGNKLFLQESGHTFDSPSLKSTVVYLGNEAQGVLAYAELQDEIRPEAFMVIQKLNSLGLNTVLLSGDRALIVSDVVKKLGLKQGIGDLLPQEKLNIIVKMQNAGERVAFIGDGINDAPALQISNLSFAIGGGSDVARAAADVVLLSGGLNNVLNFFSLAKKTMSMMKQNLFWAFAYNIICIPIAAGILYPFYGIKFPPALASLAMALSSLTVVLNALRLKTKKV